MPARYEIVTLAPDENHNLAGLIGAEPTGEAQNTEEDSSWASFLPGLANSVTSWIASDEGKETIQAGTQLYLSSEQRKQAEKEAQAKQQQQMLQMLTTGFNTTPVIQSPAPQPTQVVVQAPAPKKTNWILPAAIGGGALLLLGGFMVLKK